MDPSIKVLSSQDAAHVAETCASTGLTTDEFARLRTDAVAAKAAAYCPYSKFRVGAVLLSEDGAFVTGANIENASYPVGTCAERVAFGRAILDGHRRFRAVAVAADNDKPCSPCGMCRQFIREFCDLSLPVIMFDVHENYVVMELQKLLPLSFGPDALNNEG